ncbi:TPM domain-containing protein [Winogradskyella marincola]|uniref:TPM domain-containing protein n=1 Tax=Winogradskyella marincola TaxID=3037795 RepID=A0ABT6FXP2_9FLAO|nr:TPM domain-containing protein [Winogradskyella sp. YYF002]MDG4714563.1 TPM domain-containing protein [Winogradskyella sp. YYF002]
MNCKETKSSIGIDIPENTNQNIVYDTAELFSKTERDSLAYKIIQFEQQTTNQTAILTVDSIPKHMDIMAFGKEVANSWGIGNKEKDNGLLITISRYDRKIAINTGLGTEKTISDYECKIIIDSVMIPQFRKKQYYKGVKKALDALFALWD